MNISTKISESEILIRVFRRVQSLNSYVQYATCTCTNARSGRTRISIRIMSFVPVPPLLISPYPITPELTSSRKKTRREIAIFRAGWRDIPGRPRLENDWSQVLRQREILLKFYEIFRNFPKFSGNFEIFLIFSKLRFQWLSIVSINFVYDSNSLLDLENTGIIIIAHRSYYDHHTMQAFSLQYHKIWEYRLVIDGGNNHRQGTVQGGWNIS